MDMNSTIELTLPIISFAGFHRKTCARKKKINKINIIASVKGLSSKIYSGLTKIYIYIERQTSLLLLIFTFDSIYMAAGDLLYSELAHRICNCFQGSHVFEAEVCVDVLFKYSFSVSAPRCLD